MHTYTPANSIADGPITTLLSMLCILVGVLLRAHVKRGKCLNDFKFGTSIGPHFLSDGAASMAVKVNQHSGAAELLSDCNKKTCIIFKQK